MLFIHLCYIWLNVDFKNYFQLFQINIQYPNSGVRSKNLTGEEAILGRAIHKGAGFKNAASKCPDIAKDFQASLLEKVQKELDALVTSNEESKSILRKKDEASLLKFSWLDLHQELTEKAPNFLNVLYVVFQYNDSDREDVRKKKEDKMRKELPALLTAASSLLAIRSQEMSAVQYIHSLILMKGGAKKSAFSRLNATKSCMSYESTIKKQDEIAGNAVKHLQSWQKEVWNGREREQELMEAIANLQGDDVGCVLSKARLENELECLRLHMHPGYYMVGDNADMRTHVRHHRLNYKDKDLHMFQLAAYKNRVSANHLDPSKPIDDIKNIPFSRVLPSEEDVDVMHHKMARHVADAWRKHLAPFKHCTVPSRHHQHLMETSRRTQRVSDYFFKNVFF